MVFENVSDLSWSRVLDIFPTSQYLDNIQWISAPCTLSTSPLHIAHRAPSSLK